MYRWGEVVESLNRVKIYYTMDFRLRITQTLGKIVKIEKKK